MLRITTDKTPRVLTFRLEGRLEGPWVTLMADSWHSERARVGKRRLCVNLNGVTFIGPDAKVLLTQMHKEGAEFIACDPMTKAILAEIVGE